MNLILFGDALFTDKTFFLRDVSFFHYPLKRLVTEAYAHGEWPLWNPYVQLGQPLLANPNSMAVYPTQILFQLLPFHLAFELHFVLHSILAGIATFYLARRLGLSPFAALLSAGVYNFSGVTLSFMNLFNILPVVALLPLVTLTLVKMIEHATPLRVVAAVLVLGCFFLLLEPLSSLAAGLFVLPVVLLTYTSSDQAKPSWPKALFLLAIAGLSGLLLACIQILPTAELIHNSGRRGGLSLEIVSFWSLHPVATLQLVLPRVFGEYYRMVQPSAWGTGFFEGREPYLLSCYFGLFPLGLAAGAALFSQRRSLVILLSGITLVAIILAMGRFTPAFPWLFHHLPLFRYGRYPVKYLYVATLSLALLAGLGWERTEVLRKEWSSRSRSLQAALLVWSVLGLTALAFLWWLSSGSGWRVMAHGREQSDSLSFVYQGTILNISRPLIVESLRHLQVHIVMMLLVLAMVLWKRVHLGIVRWGVVVFILFDLLTHNFWINPLIPEDLYAQAPAAHYLNSQADAQKLGRIYSLLDQGGQNDFQVLGRTDSAAWISIFRKLTLSPFLSAKDHVYYSVFRPIDRLETLPSQRAWQELTLTKTLEEKLRLLQGLNVGHILSVNAIDSPLLSLEAIFELNSNQPLRVYKLANPLPRVFLLAPSPSGRPDTGVFVDPGSRQATGGGGEPLFVRPVPIARYSSNHIEMKATVETKSQLILLDSDYPGWKATLDGQDVRSQPVGYGFRAIDVPGGNHDVMFDYRPGSFRLGLAISSLTLAGWILVLLVRCFGKPSAKLKCE